MSTSDEPYLTDEGIALYLDCEPPVCMDGMDAYHALIELQQRRAADKQPAPPAEPVTEEFLLTLPEAEQTAWGVLVRSIGLEYSRPFRSVRDTSYWQIGTKVIWKDKDPTRQQVIDLCDALGVGLRKEGEA